MSNGIRLLGIAAASLVYFDKSVNELTVSEVAYLAALPKAPSNYHPFRHEARAVERRNWVVDQMTETFDPNEYTDTYTETLKKFIEDKAAGKLTEPEEEEPIPSEVTDLFAKLRESLEMAEAKK